MGEFTGISWTHATFNPWWGCQFVGGSPACAPAEGEEGGVCYAYTWDKRMGGNNWGADGPRRFFGDKHWAEPLKWNKKAEKAGSRIRVFCMSMGDWAEGRPDQHEHLERLWELIRQTPWLDWLMLTKRPQLIGKLYPQEWQRNPLPNVWMGITTENQKWLDNRWDFLKRIDAAVYWLSIEPLFGRVVLPADFLSLGKRAWAVVGGQSGSHAVAMHPDWPRAIRDQCISAGVPYHFKQHGEWVSFRDSQLVSLNGNIRQVEVEQSENPDQCRRVTLVHIGKKAAGRTLDGRTWDEFPKVSQ